MGRSANSPPLTKAIPAIPTGIRYTVTATTKAVTAPPFAAEAVPRAFKRDELRLHLRRPQLIHDPFGLLDGHIVVLGSVQAERRGSMGCDPVERAGENVLAPFVLKVAAQKEGQHFRRVH